MANSNQISTLPDIKSFTSEKYSPALQSSDFIKIKNRYELFINGKFTKPNSGSYFNTINPATEEKLSQVAKANQKDVDLAVKAAKNAYNKVRCN